MQKKLRLSFIFVLITWAGISAEETKKITIAAHWLPQAQFSGYYVGIEKGIYARYGLDVDIIHATTGITSQELLLDGKADFATLFLTTALMLRSNGDRIINVCQLSQKCGQVLVTKKSEIKELSDLRDKKIGIWRSGFDEILMSFSYKYNLNIQTVLISSTINLFLFGGIQGMTTMWFNEYHSILNAGLDEEELNLFFFADYGFNIPEDGLYMHEDKYDKETVDKFTKATLEAWDYTFSHKEEAIEMVKKEMQKRHIAFNKPHQAWMLNRIQDLFKIENKKYKPGQLLRTDFDNAYQVLSSQEKIRSNFSYEEFYFGIK